MGSEMCIRDSIILPLYKKGDRLNVDNYRGITILSCLGKLFTAFVNERLTKFTDKHGIIGPEQAGFRAGFSTMDHVLAFKLLIDLYLHKKKRLYVAFIDYSKAFDRIDRVCLWDKILSQNVTGKMFQVIFNLYKQAKSCVKVNGSKSEFFPCMTGVRQGENLSPLLFAMYLSDLSKELGDSYNGLSNIKELGETLLQDDDVFTYFNLYVLL